jgi:4'-phosphopantetheinyl transferase
MKSYLFDHPLTVDIAELESDVATLPQWRRELAMRFRNHIDRVLCTKAYMLLRKGLHDDFGISGNPIFEYAMHGKPALKDYPDIHFNLSHCRHGVLCVIGRQPVGCDIEDIQESLDIDLVHHCFSDSEAARILAASNPCIEFTRLWTIKEAILKLSGKGITDDLPALLTPDLLNRITLETHTDEKNGCAYTIASYRGA